LPRDSLTLIDRNFLVAADLSRLCEDGKNRHFITRAKSTSLLDSGASPRSELVALYHERWEIELGFDEIKTHMLAREDEDEQRQPQAPDGARP
jgi:hypothetical protein